MPEPAQRGHLTYGTARQQHPGAGCQPGQGGDVQMVGVQMGDERQVRQRGGRRGRGAPAAAQMREPAGEEGVGQHARAGVLDRAGGMAPPGDLHRHSLCSLRATPPEPTCSGRVGGETLR